MGLYLSPKVLGTFCAFHPYLELYGFDDPL